MGTFQATRNEYLKFEEGPSVDITLQWATYYDAADEAGISRLYGGIHFPADDGIMGSTCGILETVDGSIANDEVNVTIELDAFNNCTIGWNSLPSFSYKVEASVDLKSLSVPDSGTRIRLLQIGAENSS